jgi:hypothetical protein
MPMTCPGRPAIGHIKDPAPHYITGVEYELGIGFAALFFIFHSLRTRVFDGIVNSEN